jgi:hypothetical protein
MVSDVQIVRFRTITGNAFISIANIYSDIGYIPNQIVLLHTENSTQYFPALLENYAIQIPQTSLKCNVHILLHLRRSSGILQLDKTLFAIK